MKMNQNNIPKNIKKYLRAINRALPLTHKKRKNVMTHFSKGVWEYYAEQPDMTIEDIYQEFGTVEEVVESLMEEIPSEYVIQHMKLKRILMYILICTVICITGYMIFIHIRAKYISVQEIEVELNEYPKESEE